MLNSEDLEYLHNDNPLKSREVSLLGCFLQPEVALMRPVLTIEGPKSSGKTYTIRRYLKYLKSKYGVESLEVECQYCFSSKDVLRKVLKELIGFFKLKYTEAENEISKCEGVGNFVGCLKQVMNGSGNIGKNGIVIVLDRIDSLDNFEDVETISNCFSKIHEQFPEVNGLTFILTCLRYDSLDYATQSVPNINFSPYSDDELKEILTLRLIDKLWPIELINDHMNGSIDKQRRYQIFKQFIGLMMDTYREYFGSTIEVIEPIINRIWPIFLDPIVRNGGYQMGMNDILTTFLENKDILSNEEVVFRDIKNTSRQLVNDEYDQDPLLTKLLDNLDRDNNANGNFDLSKKVKYLVIASFLASFNDPKYDSIYFTKHGGGLSVKRRRNLNRSKISKSEGVLRREMSIPQPFKMERFLAILRSIWLENEGSSNMELINDVGLMNEMASLSALKIIVKLNQGDTIGGQTKWKCNVHWDIVLRFSKDVNFNIENYLQE